VVGSYRTAELETPSAPHCATATPVDDQNVLRKLLSHINIKFGLIVAECRSEIAVGVYFRKPDDRKQLFKIPFRNREKMQEENPIEGKQVGKSHQALIKIFQPNGDILTGVV
jgi:hypothetical protein